jgi:hypothetical protein
LKAPFKQHAVSPETLQALKSTYRGAPHRRIADQQTAREYICLCLQQRVEIRSASDRKRVRRRTEIDQLPSQHVAPKKA